jgi:hypothetical protein
MESGWEILTFYIDFPISVFILSALYSFNHPLLLFGLFGTVWWYVVNWLVLRWVVRLTKLFSNHNSRMSDPR